MTLDSGLSGFANLGKLIKHSGLNVLRLTLEEIKMLSMLYHRVAERIKYYEILE